MTPLTRDDDDTVDGSEDVEAPALCEWPFPSALGSVGESAYVVGGGAVGASYESKVMCVWAGDNGAPSGPANRTFFLSPDGDLVSGSRGGADGKGGEGRIRSNRFSRPSSSATPGVATVLHAPLAKLSVRPGVRRLSCEEVSMPGRFVRGF